MSHSPRYNRDKHLVLETYNKIVEGKTDDPLKLLKKTIDYLKYEKSNVAEISLLYCLQSDYYFDNGKYEKAYKYIKEAAQLDSERKEVLQSLINIHTPHSSDDEHSKALNPYQDDEKAHKYCTQLQQLYPDDVHSLYITSHCYSALGLYDESIRVLKRIFAKINKTLKKNKNTPALADSQNFADEIKKQITKTLIDRYKNCPNHSHETIIRYLIELIEWKYNNFNASNLHTCIEEIWERIEYILNKHIDFVNDENHDTNAMEHNWNTICKLFSSIPCSIPLSTALINDIFDIFVMNEKYESGVDFFTRLITEYQTYNENMLSIHAKFDKYHVLLVNRAKLYQIIGAKQEMMEDIEDCNVRMLCDGMHKEAVCESNLSQYIINDDKEAPIIETEQQIKKRRASRVSNIGSNIVISPMPKKYRDIHLTPKRGQSERNTVRRRRRRTMNESAFDRVCRDRDDRKQSEEAQNAPPNVQNGKDFLLENKIVDLKNDLHRETSKNMELKKEIERLQQNMVTLSDNLSLHVAANSEMEGSLLNGERTELNGNNDKLNALKMEIDGLKVQDQSKEERIQSLKRQIAILKDCKMKNKIILNDSNILGSPQKDETVSNTTTNQSFTSRICGFFIKLVKLLIGLLAFIFLVVLFIEAKTSTDLQDIDINASDSLDPATSMSIGEELKNRIMKQREMMFK